ncbi:hypothetical protein H7K24_12310 [Mycobacterium fragae]|uniref:Secreted protein n=1 Tax=Mycobacterium fragae TaxID=1260918 RepID=A0A1X1UJT5_9MYCO|nr:hypothetical protein [Mycobacterium fragae]MCV7400936.1 hypothetical protein [Mycobacterium fragae]ORV57086.1 hypothetical protein AWC06_02600 [Mycobacterium fragae]
MTTVKFAAGAAIASLTLGVAPISAADVPDETDVPGMTYGVEVGAPCSNFHRYIFGRTASGQAVACVSSDGSSGNWVLSSPLSGVQQIGTPCPPGQDAAAQSPDGVGLMCVINQGWQPGP